MGFQVLSPRFAAVCVLAALPFAVHADDLTLKDGSTIKGTIVGFDDNSFKVQTSYGFALVRKDQVVTIRVTGPGASDAPEQNPQPAAEKTSPEKPKTDPAIAAIPAATPKPTTAPVADAAKVSDKPGRRRYRSRLGRPRPRLPCPLPNLVRLRLSPGPYQHLSLQRRTRRRPTPRLQLPRLRRPRLSYRRQRALQLRRLRQRRRPHQRLRPLLSRQLRLRLRQRQPLLRDPRRLSRSWKPSAATRT